MTSIMIAAGSLDGSPVADLTAGFTIKRRLGSDEIDFFAFNCFGFALPSP